MENILETIYKSGLKFLESLTPEETYATVVEEAIKLVKADYGSIFLEQQGELQRVYTSWSSLKPVLARKRGLVNEVYKSQKPVILGVNKGVKVGPDMKKLGIKSMAIIPLHYRKKPVGVLNTLSRQENHFTDRELNILKLFASMASLAIIKMQLYSETKKALETRDLFISMAAHEFRTPLTTISGYVQLLYSKLTGANVPESRWIEELAWEVGRLTQLVNELLAANRIKSGALQYNWRECGLRDVIARAILDFRFTHPDHKVIFQDQVSKDKDLIVGDFDKLLQVSLNLLDNAAKFSSTDKEIVVGLKFKDPYIILTVRDHGMGIEKKNLQRVFEGFYKGEDFREGMGLGLFLAKNIIEEHRGSIHLHSRVNKGTLVEVRLPRARL
ncbi:MAG: GAF domain-containing sensor histidine kinase [Patescibacteria group bacterium]|nr:GAF domain-containing sensor histidine kinase [Patescibacteria group bacterium]